jgi:hypothetical protein
MYFRHPFLHVGNTKSKADSLEEFLNNNGYTVAPVTVDNEDYLFALAYKRALAKNDIELAKRIGTDYISYMEEKIIYYEQQTIELFGRNICQILLVHASALNSIISGPLSICWVTANILCEYVRGTYRLPILPRFRCMELGIS